MKKLRIEKTSARKFGIGASSLKMKAAALTMALAASMPLSMPCAIVPLAAQAATVARARTASKNTQDYYVTANMLNVRSGPGTSYRQIGTISKGMIISVRSFKKMKDGSWAKIKFGEVTAYVSAQYIAKK